MGEPRWSPGPLLIERKEHDRSRVWLSTTSRVAKPWFSLASVVVTIEGEPSEEGEANAALFAAAPTLYEELANLRRRFHAALVGTGTDPEFADAAVAAADKAMAQARGEQP
jgi:hypothetical protein